MIKEYIVKHGVCRCEHFDAYHEGYDWFHMTACKVHGCECKKFTKIGNFTFEDAPKKAQEELAI